MNIDWKEKLSGLASELPEGEETGVEQVQEQKESKQKEPLRIELDKRNGKPATLITDFQGSNEALKELTKKLKLKCGSGGSCRDGEILIQGDFRTKIADLLTQEGFKIKKINFK